MLARRTLPTCSILLALAGCHPGHFGASLPSEAAPTGDRLPCPVSAALKTRCQSCHGETPVDGAPMPLVTWEDLQRPSVTDPSRAVWQLVSERIHDGQRPMPPPPMAPLSGEQSSALDEWMAAGAADSDQMCVPVEPPPPAPRPTLPCKPGETYLAHAPLATDLGFEVPGKVLHGGDVTVCFSFVRPEGAAAQAIAWGPVLGDERIIHHISLFATSEPVQDGAIAPCQIKNATYLMGWEPGREITVLPPDVGLELPSKGSRGIILEVHYHNAYDYRTSDASGMAICTADSPRPYTAGVLTLGTEDIEVPARGMAEATGWCPAQVTSAFTEPLHVLSTAPHMHNSGLSLQTDVLHADGSVENLAPPRPWDPHQQALYTHDPAVEIRPGDVLKTVCRYQNKNDLPVVFGSRAENEMCYSYNVVYPITALPPRLDQAPLRLCDCPSGDNCGF